ncbi:MAG: ABC transporter permease subunit [Acidobacteriota bacterium]|nr:ABC transporter permease subunit [Blastocatellia bacterium]MDW8411186.1 ABC transporter permease subunit [Acidobacteriota bacterium]
MQENKLSSLLKLRGEITKPIRLALLSGWMLLFLIFWIFSPMKALPTPTEVLLALRRMFAEQHLLYHLVVTLKLNIVGLVYATVVSLLISYLGTLPLFYHLNRAVQLLRYIPFVGFNLIFLTLFTIGFPLKVAWLTTGMSFFLVTGMTAVIESIPRMKYELAQVLGYNGWQTFYTVVARPTLPHMMDIVAQNAAIGWVMITSIETYARTEGGIGAQIYQYSSTNNLAEVYGLLMLIGLIAAVEDAIFVFLRRMLFPYSTLAERA